MVFEKHNPSLFMSILLLLGAYGILRIGGVDYLTGGLAGCLVLLAMGSAFDYHAARLTRYKVKLIQESHEDVKVLELYRTLTPEQLEMIQGARIIVEHVLTPNGRDDRWRVMGMPPTRDYYRTEDILAVWSAASHERMAPIGAWSDGSIRREVCQTLTSFFCLCGFCEPSAGNQPARWVGDGYLKAHKALFGMQRQEVR